jgi:hypothetical protein
LNIAKKIDPDFILFLPAIAGLGAFHGFPIANKDHSCRPVLQRAIHVHWILKEKFTAGV